MSVFDALTSTPSEFTSGTTVTWSESLPYASGSYTIAMAFQALNTPVDGYEGFSINGSGSGTTWTFTITAASAPKPGIYRWQRFITRASDSAVAELDSGEIVIRPSLAATPTTSTAATLLANLETAISTLSSGTNQSVNFNGQSFTKKDMGNLLDQRTRLQAEVLREKEQLDALRGATVDRNINVRFV